MKKSLFDRKRIIKGFYINVFVLNFCFVSSSLDTAALGAKKQITAAGLARGPARGDYHKLW